MAGAEQCPYFVDAQAHSVTFIEKDIWFPEGADVELDDADGEPLDGSAHAYTMTFPDGALPPVKAFWSLTMYDGATQLFIHNPIDRYLLNSTTMDDFRFNDDGSLTLLVQSDPPDDAWRANWPAAPDGPFYMVVRLYGPEAETLDGTRTPSPAVREE